MAERNTRRRVQMSHLTQALWDKYRRERDLETRALLLDQYLGLVHYSASKLADHIPRELSICDLIGAGTVGLVQALESFDPGRGLAFSTLAVPRIRGAMLDELRRWDRVPRLARERRRRVEQMRTKLQRRLGRAPRLADIADALGIDIDTLCGWTEGAGVPIFLPLEASVPSPEAGEYCLTETIPDPTSDGPDVALTRAETVEELRTAIARLPEKDRMVLSLYYYEELTFKQIGLVLHVSESRISQIHSQALRNLRGELCLAREKV